MARRSTLVLVLTITGRVLNFGVQVALSNLLGLAGFGTFTFCGTVLTFLGAACLGGFSQTTVRYVAMSRSADQPADVRNVLRLALTFMGFLTLVCMAALYVFRDQIANGLLSKPEFAPYTIWIIVALPGMVVMGWVGFALRAFRDVKSEALVRHNLKPVLLIAAVLIAWPLVEFDLSWALIALTLSVTGTAIFGMIKLRHHVRRQPVPTGSPYRNREMLRFAMPIWLSRFSSLIMGQADRLLIGALSSLSQVGIYHSAYRVADFQKLTAGAFVPAFSTAVAEANSRNDHQALIEYYRMAVRWTLLVNLPIAMACWLFATPILRLFGHEFVTGTTVLSIIAFSSLINAGAGPAGLFLQMMGRERIEMIALTCSAILVVGLNVLLIPAYGAAGAACGSGLAVICLNVTRVLALRRILHLFPFTPLTLRLLLVAALSALATCLVQPAGVVVQAITLLVTYFGMVLLFAMDPGDRKIMYQFVDRIKMRIAADQSMKGQ